MKRKADKIPLSALKPRPRRSGPCYDSPMAKVTLTGDNKIEADGIGARSVVPTTLEIELQSNAIIRVSLCQGEIKVDLPGVKHVEIDTALPDAQGRTNATIGFGNGELKWLGPEPVIKE